jgi:hypothetical protein
MTNGHSVFTYNSNKSHLTHSPVVDEKISTEDYNLWLKDFTWEALHGIRFGQSFCNHFNIQDNLLYYTMMTVEESETYIRKNYIA